MAMHQRMPKSHLGAMHQRMRLTKYALYSRCGRRVEADQQVIQEAVDQ